MRERRLICVNCWREYPYQQEVKSCSNCGHSLVPKSGGIRRSFATTLLLVLLLWIGTPIVIGIWASVTADPSSGYGPDFSVLTVGGLLLILYAVVGFIVGLAMLGSNKPVGSGILTGTGLGLLIGFITCFAVAGVVV